VLKKVSTGRAIDYNALKNQLLAIPPAEVVQMFLRVLFDTCGDMHNEDIFHFTHCNDVVHEWIERIQMSVAPISLLDGPIEYVPL
jgi:hypothetical protein